MYTLGLETDVLPYDYWQEFAKEPNPDFVPLLWTENLTNEEINKLVQLAQRRFYFRPKYVLRHLSQVRSLGEFRAKARAGFRVVFGW